jgi:hypothetical protein
MQFVGQHVKESFRIPVVSDQMGHADEARKSCLKGRSA